MNKKEMLVVRIDPELKRKLEELAERDQRTLSSLVNRLLSASIAGYTEVLAGWAHMPSLLGQLHPGRKGRK